VFFLDKEVGKTTLNEIVRELIEKFGSDYKVKIVLRERTLYESYYSALNSVQFHRIPLDELNQFKEVAHLAFWITKLKPIRITAARTLKTQYQFASDLAKRDRLFSNSNVSIEPVSLDELRELDDFLDMSNMNSNPKVENFDINEWVAVMMIHAVCKIAWIDRLARILDSEKKALMEKRMTFLEERFLQKSSKALIKSLRYHNFSARGLASAIEVALDVDFD
jgi:hypothetical protein